MYDQQPIIVFLYEDAGWTGVTGQVKFSLFDASLPTPHRGAKFRRHPSGLKFVQLAQRLDGGWTLPDVPLAACAAASGKKEQQCGGLFTLKETTVNLSTSKKLELMHHGYISMQVLCPWEPIGEGGASYFGQAKFDTKSQCNPVNFDFQNWNAVGTISRMCSCSECDSLAQLRKMWKEGRRGRDGWPQSVFGWKFPVPYTGLCGHSRPGSGVTAWENHSHFMVWRIFLNPITLALNKGED